MGRLRQNLALGSGTFSPPQHKHGFALLCRRGMKGEWVDKGWVVWFAGVISAMAQEEEEISLASREALRLLHIICSLSFPSLLRLTELRTPTERCLGSVLGLVECAQLLLAQVVL